MLKPEIVSGQSDENESEGQEQISFDAIETEDNEGESADSADVTHSDLANQLEHNLAGLFLKMQSILHIPASSIQEIIQQFNQIHALSLPLLNKTTSSVLKRCLPNADESLIAEVVNAVSESNVFSKCCDSGGCLSTIKRRNSYVLAEFPLVMPVEYMVDRETKPVVYVPILPMLQKMLNKSDILDKALSIPESEPFMYSSYNDGDYFKNNSLLNSEEFRIALGFYVDDFEVANPLGTSRGKHKICAIYWVLANIPVKHRSMLRSIQLGILCNAGTVKEYGYEKVMQPLVKDLVHLEQTGLFIDQLGATVKGTVLYVSADNLGAHSMAGFLEGFTAARFCRFCMGTRTEVQHTEVGSSNFETRTKDTHDRHVKEVKQDPSLSKLYGVRGSCPLTDALQNFHAVTGYPPDILHDLLEGIVPAELCLCLSEMIKKKYISLESVNHAIKNFAYTFSDKTNRPQQIPKAFATKGTIGGNGHENWTLLRLLPLLIGDDVPEGDTSWEILMLLKDIFELAVASKHTEESIDFLKCKITEHRELLQSAFPGFRLKPKHHFVEHYPQLIKAFGPLSDVWTMRFEGKHKFLKK